MERPIGYHEVNLLGMVQFNACTPAKADNICIEIAEAWDDNTPRRDIILSCGNGYQATMYRMDVDKAEALGLLLCSAARGMRQMAKSIDEDAAEEAARNKLTEQTIMESGLSVRGRKVLRRAMRDDGITAIDKLTEEYLENARNCGDVTIKEIRQWVESRTQEAQ